MTEEGELTLRISVINGAILGGIIAYLMTNIIWQAQESFLWCWGVLFLAITSLTLLTITMCATGGESEND
jgi:hypothetical protein